MIKTAILAVFALIATVSPPVYPADWRAPLQVINQEGELIISDGSSYYAFKKDGQFLSGPIDGISGRVISGKWKCEGSPDSMSAVFDIEGNWEWVNGTFSLHDVRLMKMAVYHIGSEFESYPKPTGGDVYGMEGEKSFRVYKCYFIIESIEKKAP